MIVCATLLIMALVRKMHIQKVNKHKFCVISTAIPLTNVFNIHSLVIKYQMSRMGMFLGMETSHNQCTMYQTHQFHLFYAPTNPPRFLLIFLRLCLCGSHYGCRLTPADWRARIRSSLFWRLKNGIRRCLPAKPWLISRYFSSWRIGLPIYTASTVQP